MNELDQIRQQWQSMKLNCERLEETNRQLSHKLSSRLAVTNQEKLASHYTIVGILSLILLPSLAFMLYYTLEAPIWLRCLYGGMGLPMGAIDLYFASFVKRCDYISMPTCEALAHARRVHLWIARLHSIGMAMATIVLVPLFFHLAKIDHEGVLVGGVAGLIIGLALGFCIYYRNRRLSKRILADLECEE